MKAQNLKLKVVNETEKGKFELEVFKPYMSFESFIGCIVGEAEILRPTGAKDDNGKMIYEGDIVEYLDSRDCSTENGYDFDEYINIGEVYYDNDICAFDVTNREDIEREDVLHSEKIRVVGNKYTHPNLIKERRISWMI